jgi:hypothetical protein
MVFVCCSSWLRVECLLSLWVTGIKCVRIYNRFYYIPVSEKEWDWDISDKNTERQQRKKKRASNRDIGAHKRSESDATSEDDASGRIDSMDDIIPLGDPTKKRNNGGGAKLKEKLITIKEEKNSFFGYLFGYGSNNDRTSDGQQQQQQSQQQPGQYVPPDASFGIDGGSVRDSLTSRGSFVGDSIRNSFTGLASFVGDTTRGSFVGDTNGSSFAGGETSRASFVGETTRSSFAGDTNRSSLAGGGGGDNVRNSATSRSSFMSTISNARPSMSRVPVSTAAINSGVPSNVAITNPQKFHFSKHLSMKTSGYFASSATYARRYALLKGPYFVYYNSRHDYENKPKQPINKRAINFSG